MPLKINFTNFELKTNDLKFSLMFMLYWLIVWLIKKKYVAILSIIHIFIH